MKKKLNIGFLVCCVLAAVCFFLPACHVDAMVTEFDISLFNCTVGSEVYSYFTREDGIAVLAIYFIWPLLILLTGLFTDLRKIVFKILVIFMAVIGLLMYVFAIYLVQALSEEYYIMSVGMGLWTALFIYGGIIIFALMHNTIVAGAYKASAGAYNKPAAQPEGRDDTDMEPSQEPYRGQGARQPEAASGEEAVTRQQGIKAQQHQAWQQDVQARQKQEDRYAHTGQQSREGQQSPQSGQMPEDYDDRTEVFGSGTLPGGSNQGPAAQGRNTQAGNAPVPNTGGQPQSSAPAGTARFCPRCGSQVVMGAKFCSKCGSSIGARQ